MSIDDADDLRVGQKAQVRFLGLHERNIPIIMGSLTRLSADSLVDEKSGDVFTPPRCASRGPDEAETCEARISHCVRARRWLC